MQSTKAKCLNEPKKLPSHNMNKKKKWEGLQFVNNRPQKMAIFRKMNLETRKFNGGKGLQFVNNHPQKWLFLAK